MSIDKIVPQKNEVAFKWFNNYAGITLKTPTTTLVIDPVDINSKEITPLDTILITHEHYDHMEPEIIKTIVENNNPIILTNSSVHKILKENKIESEILTEKEIHLFQDIMNY